MPILLKTEPVLLEETSPKQTNAMQGWKLVANDFRLLRNNGEIWGIIPTKYLILEELGLFKNPTVSTYAISFRVLEGDNLNLFFMCAMRAKESQIRINEAGE